MQRAALFDCLGFDLLSSIEDGFSPVEIDGDRCEIAKALMRAVMVILVNEGRHCVLERPRQVVVLKQGAVLQGLVPACTRLSFTGGPALARLQRVSASTLQPRDLELTK